MATRLSFVSRLLARLFPRFHRLGLGLQLALTFAFAVSAIGCGKSAPAPVAEVAPATQASMTAEGFFAECTADAGQAAKKFAGGSVEVAGVVQSVETSLSGEAFVSLGVPENPAGVVCYTKEKNLRGRMIPGQSVKLRGKFPESQEGVTLVDCVVVEMGKHTAMNATADKLAAEFKADPQMRHKLADQYVVVTGVISARDTDDVLTTHLILAGGQGVRIDCGFSPFDKGGSENLQPGQSVKIVGKFWIDDTTDECICLRMCSVAAEEL